MVEVCEWQNRALDKSYPILFLDVLRVNSRQDGKNINKALYIALEINWKGRKAVLGLMADRHRRSKVLDTQSAQADNKIISLQCAAEPHECAHGY